MFKGEIAKFVRCIKSRDAGSPPKPFRAAAVLTGETAASPDHERRRERHDATKLSERIQCVDGQECAISEPGSAAYRK